MPLKFCALNTGTDFHLLDHIAPLASLLSIPLIVTEPENHRLAAKYYPEVNLQYWPNLEFRLSELARGFDGLIECKYWAPHLKELFRTLFNKEMRLIFCPHGQSDKGYETPLLAPYQYQDAFFYYGNLLKEMLQELGAFSPRGGAIGNYRLEYYKKEHLRLAKIADEEIFSQIKSSNKTLFYAPTWKDADSSTTFFSYATKLFKELRSDWNVILKVHPLLQQRDPALYYQLAKLHEKKENWIVLEQFPPIYPILEKIDVYLGDYSSIGYDMLAFRKPMFFFSNPHNLSPRLHTCGQILNPNDHIFESIEKSLCKASNFIEKQKVLYAHAFDQEGSIQSAISRLVGGEEHIAP